MRATFVLDNNNHVKSADRAKTAPHTIAVGTPVVLSLPYKMPTGGGTVPKGAKGFVSHVDGDSGALWILMEGAEPALIYWDNMIVMMPYSTKDLEDCIAFQPIPSVLWRRLGDYLRLAASFLFIH